jgi:hypothetical protein
LKWALAGTWIASLTAAAVAGNHLAGPDRDPAAPPCDVECSLSEALRERDVLSRTYELAASLQQIDEDNIGAAIAVFESQRIGVTASEVRLFMFAWSRIDPAGAFAWANAWSGPWRGTLENAAIYAWAFREPKGAVRTLETMDDPRRRELRSSLVAGWVRSGDTAGLSDYLFSRPASRERSRLIGELLAELIQLENGPDAVRSWAEGVSKDAPNQAKATAFLTAGGALAQNDPNNATMFFEANQSFEYAQPALRTIARRWVDFHDPRDLFAWLVTLEPSESRDAAVNAGFSRWWSISPQEAAGWVRASSGEAAFDPAVAVFARETSRESVAQAIEWADGIQDPALRRRTIVPILRLWVAEDRRAAREWMNENSMPKELQREFLSP